MTAVSIIRQRALAILKILFPLLGLTGSIIFVLYAFDIPTRLSARRVSAILLLEVALVWAVFQFRGWRQAPPEREDVPDTNTKDKRALAIAYCKDELGFYEDVGGYNHYWWVTLQIATIVLGSIGTVLATLSDATVSLMVFRTIAVAATTVAASVSSSFSFQKESVRQASTADLLRGELIKFETSTKPYESNAQDVVGDFVSKVREIVASENQNWASSIETKKP